jgi:hypothetical protein
MIDIKNRKKMWSKILVQPKRIFRYRLPLINKTHKKAERNAAENQFKRANKYFCLCFDVL